MLTGATEDLLAPPLDAMAFFQALQQIQNALEKLCSNFKMLLRRPSFKPTTDTFKFSTFRAKKQPVAAIHQVVAVGACPFADFSIWGPYGQRLLRKQTFQSFHLNPVTGDWQRREQPGPASFHQWYQSWKCYRTAMLLVEAAEAERLDSYSELIRGFVQQYGDEAWPFVSQADSRMRSEHLDRIKRELRANPAHGYEENKPWSACYAAAVKENDFWHRELATPALLYMTRNKRDTKAPESSGTASDQANKRPKTRAARRFTGTDQSRKGDDGLFSHNRKGVEVCRLYNQGKCGNEKAQGKCKAGRSHQCDRCLGGRDPALNKRPPEEGPAPSGPESKRRRTETQAPTAVPLGPSAEPSQPSSASARKRRAADSEAVEANEGTGYGYWTRRGDPAPDKPMALIMFSGRPRKNDLADCLTKLGWLVCAIDTAVIPTNLLDDSVWTKVERDISLGLFDCIWLGTPCGTFSPLRNTPPGPKPLRDVQHIQGLPSSQLRPSEQKQLKEANILVDRSAVAAERQTELGKPWGWENPDHGEEKVSMWKMPKVKRLRERADTAEANFDQCRMDLATTKPTKFLTYKMDFSDIDGMRCNHEKQKFKRADGSEYLAAHESTVQKWVQGPDGKMERASRAQGEYTPKLCELIAKAIHRTAPEEWHRKELAAEPLP
eukprot:s1791_g19.t1